VPSAVASESGGFGSGIEPQLTGYGYPAVLGEPQQIVVEQLVSGLVVGQQPGYLLVLD
jgi:hypothetical protein